MTQPNDAYTIVIFRGAKSSPLRFSFSRTTVHRAKILGVFFIVAELILLFQYALQTGEVWELRALREELATVREQTNAFSASIDDLKRRFLAIKEVNQRLRVMLGVEALKPEDYLNGRGGGETPITEDSTGAVEQQAEAQGVSTSDGGSDGAWTWDKDLLLRVHKEITRLQHEAIFQERILEELEEVASEKSARWDSTPSIKPVKEGWLTSGFGPRVSPFTGQLAMHDGLDIGAAPNVPVLAPAAGRVTAVGFDPKMGNMVNLDHGYGLQTQYGHMAKYFVKIGQRIKRGDIIGLVGSTGLSTGPHLHYMVKVSSQPVNPQRYILESWNSASTLTQHLD